LTEFATKFGDELVQLAPDHIYQNYDPSNPSIMRVGNVLMDGSIKDSKAESSIWH